MARSDSASRTAHPLADGARILLEPNRPGHCHDTCDRTLTERIVANATMGFGDRTACDAVRQCLASWHALVGKRGGKRGGGRWTVAR